VTALRVCLLGLGEVGHVLAEDLRPQVTALTAWDIQFPREGSRPRESAARLGIAVTRDVREAVGNADVVISAVTAGQCVAAAQAAAPHLKPGAWYFDLNSVSPGTRLEACDRVRGAQARYVEAAVMSPIHPKRLASPMLLGGGDAEEFLGGVQPLGFSGAQFFSGKLGAASAAKMCRSVIVKGMEALFLESLMSARHFGVEDAVLGSLRGWLNGWQGREEDTFARYLIERTLLHGRRRAEEMREVARSVREAGVEPRMSEACASWQDWAGGRIPGVHDRDSQATLAGLLDELRAGNEVAG
jgi:3-hydroxyisobutyrate dehydrogenase-like beta-hydroxyacid dehydrogenase